MGRNKLNDIHEYTGYGRDKISVYLKNLIAREIVEKYFPMMYLAMKIQEKGCTEYRTALLNSGTDISIRTGAE